MLGAQMDEVVEERVVSDALGIINERAIILFFDTFDELSHQDGFHGLLGVPFLLVGVVVGCPGSALLTLSFPCWEECLD